MSERAINSYQDLNVWQDGMVLAELCYRMTKEFPREELFAMTSQIRRAAASLLLSERVGLLTQQQIKAPMEQCASLGRRIRALIRSLQQKAKR